ncbi:helix-turn-helix domain-containing protein [Streptomyces sp. NPDC086782]|uniref:helix-turn-helix domain-containing protein n=1 Tax=Streptomyces sp. NPDC086782 TaxID=3365757 RepID=UPI00380EEF09
MPLSNDEHIGARMRIARNAAGLTQVELADFLGRTDTWVANVESGRQPLDRFSVITAIADVCDVDVVWLLGQPYRLQRSGGSLAHAHIPALRTGLRRSGLILSGHPGMNPSGAPADLSTLRRRTAKANTARQAANLPRVAQLLPPLVEDLNTALLIVDGLAREDALRLLADAWARIDAALEDADRLGVRWYDVEQQTVFGRGTVAVHAAEAGVEVDQPDTGLRRVPEANVGEIPSKERQTHFAIDEARALHRMGRSASAVVKLREAAGRAPFYTYADPMARALVSDLARVGVPSQASVLSGLIRNMELVG